MIVGAGFHPCPGKKYNLQVWGGFNICP